MKTRLVQKMKFMGIVQHRVPLMAACLPITLAVAACNQPAPPAAAPAQTAVERGKMLESRTLAERACNCARCGLSG